MKQMDGYFEMSSTSDFSKKALNLTTDKTTTSKMENSLNSDFGELFSLSGFQAEVSVSNYSEKTLPSTANEQNHLSGFYDIDILEQFDEAFSLPVNNLKQNVGHAKNKTLNSLLGEQVSLSNPQTLQLNNLYTSNTKNSNVFYFCSDLDQPVAHNDSGSMSHGTMQLEPFSFSSKSVQTSAASLNDSVSTESLTKTPSQINANIFLKMNTSEFSPNYSKSKSISSLSQKFSSINTPNTLPTTNAPEPILVYNNSKISSIDLRSEDFDLMETCNLLKTEPSNDLSPKTQNVIENNILEDCIVSDSRTSAITLSLDDDASDVSPSTSVGDCSIISIEDMVSTVMETDGNSIHEEARQDSLSTVQQEDGELWKSFLEHPITVANLPSLTSDKESAADIGILYDFYKVPKEKRVLTMPAKLLTPPLNRLNEEDNEKVETDKISVNHDALILSSAIEVNQLPPGMFVENVVKDQKCIDNMDSVTFSFIRPSIKKEENSPISLVQQNIQSTKSNYPIESNYAKDKSDLENSTAKEAEQNFAADEESVTLLETNQLNFVHTNRTSSILDLPISSSNSIAYELPDLLLPGKRNDQEEETLPPTNDMFEYIMEAPKSLKQKEGEPPMSYINKGQFYCISLRASNFQPEQTFADFRVMSIVQIVFGDGKPAEEQLRLWRYWHSRQHTAKQRIIDLADYKESNMISDIEEFAHNAFAFSWDPDDVAKIFITCNCLSTDFSSQKGVKGLPLLLQIDTYSYQDTGSLPLHRGVCQLKVFCDKGAERKIRDEERKASRKRQKSGRKLQQMTSFVETSERSSSNYNRTPLDQPSVETASKSSNNALIKKQDLVRFMTVQDLTTQPYHYIPNGFASSNMRSQSRSSSPNRRLSTEPPAVISSTTPTSSESDQVSMKDQIQLESLDALRITKKRLNSSTSTEDSEILLNNVKLSRISDPEIDRNILMYVRKDEDEAFDGLMLREASLNGLKQALQEKYNIPSEKISRLLKKSKKGILVNVDDNIVRHYSDEATFIIDFTMHTKDNDTNYVVTLSAI